MGNSFKLEKGTRPDVYRFLDYREYLRAYIRWMTSAKLTSESGNTGEIIHGASLKKLDLRGNHIKEITRILGLSEWETHYFELLVNWNQASNPEKRSAYLQQLLELSVRD